jgi:hypothetical protein
LVLTYRRPGVIASARCETVPAPNLLQSDWAEVNADAERQRKRVRPIGPAKDGRKRRPPKR